MATLALLVIRTPDIEKTMQFYERLIGRTFVREQHGAGLVHYATELKGRIVFEIYPGIRTDNALGFKVVSIRGAMSRVSHLFSKPPKLTKQGDRVVHGVVFDPDGRRVELYE